MKNFFLNKFFLIVAILGLTTFAFAQASEFLIGSSINIQATTGGVQISANEAQPIAIKTDIDSSSKGITIAGTGDVTFDGAFFDCTTTETAYPQKMNGEQIYAKYIAFGAMPASTTKNVAHGITGLDQIIKVEGWLEHSSNGSRFPIPYSRTDAIGNQIQLAANATDITATTATDWSSMSGNLCMYYTKD